MFDYFAVLISVILGLALIHPLRGLVKLTTLVTQRQKMLAAYVRVKHGHIQ